MKFIVEYFGQVKGADKNNFFERSVANWSSCKRPAGTPDFVSNSGSAYFYTDTGVIRISNHWNDVATCIWTLDNSDIQYEETAAFCEWENFIRTVGITEEKEMPENTKEYSKQKVGNQLYFVNEKVA